MTPLEQAKGLAAQLASVLETIHEASDTPPQTVTKYAVVDGLNVRAGAGTTYSIIRKLALGEAVEVASVSGQWAALVGGGHVYNPSLSAARPT